MRTVIADDEPLALDLLRLLLADTGGVEVVGEAADGLEALTAIRATAPDLVILDIDMPGLGGLAAAEILKGEAGPMVIFATAHGDHALTAFGLDAADYLLKPINRARLGEAVERARRRLSPPSSLPRAVDEAVIWVPVRNGQVRTPLSQVSHATAAGDHVFLHLEGRALMHRITMARLEAMAAPCGLVRVHRSAMVRPDAVVRLIQSGKALKLRMKDGTDLPVGPAYRGLVRGWTLA